VNPTLDAVVDELTATGVAVLPGVLDADEAADALARLWAAADESERRGMSTRAETLDPNAANVRVWNLIDLDPVFAALVAHPVAEAIVSAVLGADHIVSNFTANIARPGSGSMMLHSDQSLVMPAPWSEPCTMNIIWCLSDVRFENGATLHVPGSHRIATHDDVPEDLADRLVPFEAPAGSIIAMDGRVWHTSGRNITTDQDRALAFAFYARPFVRPQWNHSVGLSAATQAACSPTLRYRLGLDVWQNVTYGRA
jgi:ectoine hydroxylase-related dioxygenase (phytanoyl-CoA dioxygenase family)